MTTAPQNSVTRDSEFDETLRLLAHVPVPEGLEDRIHAALKAAPAQGRLLTWPAAAGSGRAGNWARVAAAAAIALVVIGGGWGVSMHVQRTLAARGMAAPVAQPAGSGFATAGAMRTPQTVKGPEAEKQQVGKSASQQVSKPAKPLPAEK